MRIPLDRQSTSPLYQQIGSYLRQGILSGSLAPETRLPAIRQLAQTLGVNRITVENAYAELEADGLIFTRVGSGTYILPPNSLPLPPKDAIGAPWPLWQQDLQTRNGKTIHDLMRCSKPPVILTRSLSPEASATPTYIRLKISAK